MSSRTDIVCLFVTLKDSFEQKECVCVCVCIYTERAKEDTIISEPQREIPSGPKSPKTGEERREKEKEVCMCV